MENFSILSKHAILGIFLCFSSLAVAQDFKVQHIQDDVASAGGTNTGFTAVSSTTSAFAIPANNRKTHAGRSDSNNTVREGDDMAGARVLTGTNTLTYYREGGSNNNNMNFQTMLWEYTGAASGPNEFIVRGRYALDLNGTNSGDPIDITAAGVVNANKCIPFITGIMNDGNTDGSDTGSSIVWLSSATNMNIRKGSKSSNVTLYITLVEFTGSNWSVLHGTSGGDANNTGTITLKDGAAGTGTTTAVGSWSNSIIFTQSKAASTTSSSPKQYVNSQWPIIAPGSDNQTVDWTFDSGRSATTSSNHFIHVLENSEIAVTRFTDTSAADDESTIDITSASLTALDQSMIIGTSISSGGDNNYGNGWRNYYLNSTTQAAHWSHIGGSTTMSHNIQIINFNVTPPTPTTTQGPGGVVAEIELWLKANEGVELAASVAALDTDPVLNWLDNSVRNNDAVQTTGVNKPIFSTSTLNFNPTVNFDGTNHEMTASTTANDSVTIFVVGDGTYSGLTKNIINHNNGGNGSIVVEQTSATNLRGRYYDSSAASGIANTTIANGTPFLVEYAHLAGGNSELFEDGISQGTASANADNLSGAMTTYIGGHTTTTKRWDGGIAEVVIYNELLNTTKRNKVESYLAIKYGFTLGINGTSQDYVDSDNTIIWDQSDNAGYNYNVAGIGRDDASNLEQKQSKTVNTTDDIAVGIKDIATTNEGNTTNYFDDNTFLMWGHNNGLTTVGTDITKDFSSGTSVTSSVSATPIQRIWKMVVTDSVPTIKLSIPESMVAATNPGGEDYIMIISDDASFTTNVTSATMEDVGTELEVDFYIEGTKYITFGSAPEVNLGSRAATFDRTDKYISAGDVNDLAGIDYTISAWVKRDIGTGKFDVVSKRNYFDENTDLDPGADSDGNYTHGYSFRINSTNQFRMVWRDPDDSVNQIMQTNEAIPENEWHHIAATHDFSENMTILYIDGIHVYDSDDFFAKKGFAHNPMTIPSDAHFMIGAAQHLKRQQKLGGTVDEVRVWNVALSGNQLRYIMNQEIEQNGSLNADGKILPSNTTLNNIDDIPWNNLIAYYPMNTAVFGSIKDESNSGNDASMINYDLLDEQTAPLPYKTTQTGAWDTSTTWENGDVQYLPGQVSYLYASEADADKETMDYNIVQIDHDVTLENTDTSIIPVYKNGNRTVLGLIVNAGADLQLDGYTPISGVIPPPGFTTPSGNAITVSHYLKLDGTIDLEGESQLIQTYNSDLDPTSSGSLERDQQGNSNAFLYNYWCSPVGEIDPATNNNDYKLSDIFNGLGYATSGYNGTTSPLEIADYWIWKYANLTGNTYSQWQHVRSTGDLKTGEGFSMKGVDVSAPITDEQSYVFLGKPNNGDFSLPLEPGNEYLVGNPYPSAMDADEFIKDNISNLETNGRNATGNVINGALYFWDHFAVNSHYLADYQGGYATYTLMGGAVAISNDTRINATDVVGTKVPERYIPVGQGFFVSAIADTDLDNDGNPDTNAPALSQPVGVAGGQILFKNSQRVFKKETTTVDNTGSLFLKSNSKAKNTNNVKDTDTRQKIRLMYDSPNGYHRQLLVGVDENASDGFDMGYEALIAEENKEDMYWVFSNAKFLIQAVDNFNVDQTLPLGLRTDKEGLATIKIDGLENIDSSLDIFIHDKELDTHHNLKTDDYEVYLQKGEFLERFEITFAMSQPQVSLGVDDVENDKLEVHFSNEKESIVLFNPTSKNVKSVELVNILGQSIYNFNKKTNENYIEYKTNQIRTGTYIIKIETDEGVSSKKVLVE